MPIQSNIVQVNGVYYRLDDPCTACGHAFECNSDGSAKVGAYPQMSTQSLRWCKVCGNFNTWRLKRGKQPWLHKVNQDLLEE